jgi:hypothetical protein
MNKTPSFSKKKGYADVCGIRAPFHPRISGGASLRMLLNSTFLNTQQEDKVSYQHKIWEGQISWERDQKR